MTTRTFNVEATNRKPFIVCPYSGHKRRECLKGQHFPVKTYMYGNPAYVCRKCGATMFQILENYDVDDGKVIHQIKSPSEQLSDIDRQYRAELGRIMDRSFIRRDPVA